MKRDCPNEEKLADYIEGRLPEQNRSELEEHLSECMRCMEEFLIINGMVNGKESFKLDMVPSKVTDSAVHLIKTKGVLSYSLWIQKVKGFAKKIKKMVQEVLWMKSWRRWQLARTRSYKNVQEENFSCYRISSKGIVIDIEIEKTVGNKSQIYVKFIKYNRSNKRLRITLKKGDREIASYLLDGEYVLFENVSFGYYSIILTQDFKVILNYSFEMQENHHGGG